MTLHYSFFQITKSIMQWWRTSNSQRTKNNDKWWSTLWIKHFKIIKDNYTNGNEQDDFEFILKCKSLGLEYDFNFLRTDDFKLWKCLKSPTI